MDHRAPRRVEWAPFSTTSGAHHLQTWPRSPAEHGKRMGTPRFVHSLAPSRGQALSKLLDKIGLKGHTFLTDDWEGLHRLIPEDQLFTGKDLSFPIEQDTATSVII